MSLKKTSMEIERVHLSYLVDCIEIGLQNFLIDSKLNLAQNLDDNDFYNCPLYKKLTPQEKKSADTRDIRQWDVTVCCKWLIQFQWDPALSPDILQSIKNLREMRNDIVHKAYAPESYEEYVNSAKANLTVLKVLSQELEMEIDKGKNYLVLHKDSFEATWGYTTNQLIGGGSFGVVLEVRSKIDNKKTAVKLILENNLKENATIEAQNLVKCSKSNHRNVVKYIHSGYFAFTVENLQKVLQWNVITSRNKLNDETQRNIRAAFQEARDEKSNIISGLYLAMELCGENLRDWLNYCVDQVQDKQLNRITLQKTRQRMSSELIDGLNYIHDRSIIHRDLRPPNIFFAKSNFVEPIKIGDFGLSKKVEKYVTQTGTRILHEYCAPEVNNADENGIFRYSQAFDYYALGLIISEIFDPVKIFQLKGKLEKVAKGELGPNLNEDDFFEPLVQKLMSKVPSDRYFMLGSKRIPLPRMGMDDSIEKTISSQTGEEIDNEKTLCDVTNTNDSSNDSSKVELDKENDTTQSQRKLNDVTRIRKLLQSDKTFWTSKNMIKLLTDLSGTEANNKDLLSDPNHKPFTGAVNNILYKCEQQIPNWKSKLTVLLDKMGRKDLADKAKAIF